MVKITKDKKDNIAHMHLLTQEESKVIKDLCGILFKEIELILDRANLDSSVTWVPSNDYKWLIKTQDRK